MTITNRELFYRDPTRTKIPNDGVAKVIHPETEQQWGVLEWELKSFVCDGEYARGLERILNSFLINLSQSQQPAVWVSGFYGSGKSHLVRVLEYLWRDTKMPGSEKARNLVTLPDEVQDHLTELSTAGKRLGGCGRQRARWLRGKAMLSASRSSPCYSRARACPSSTHLPVSSSGRGRADISR